MEILFGLLGMILLAIVVVGSDASGKNQTRRGGSYFFGFILAFLVLPYAVHCFLNRNR